ncbi:hypothetical protein HO133_005374 [Letharia lupina]|uniref:Uncharacterized protein n=1 Tax=Letharia lupina TaxID=560253 RepID=A0A8H6C903_9LECA|nr:uncharacterized protein HO133_005374 [Letharia lupina]KAF6218831.1 hypothetical protein HO133_005374 [Letharia lupina]
MSEIASPSPPPRPAQHVQSQLLPSSIFSTPSFSSTLPFPRPTSASGAFRRSSLLKKGRLGSSQHRRRTRSVASSASHSSDGSLGDFSMENYTIDLAQLGRKETAAPPVGFEQAFQRDRSENEQKPKQPQEPAAQTQQEETDEEEAEDLLGDYTIDLGGLGDKPSSMVVGDVEKERDEVSSEDEGPEDFTVNMEKWMRGGEKWKKERRDETLDEGDEANEDPQDYTQEVRVDRGLPEESVFEPLGTSTPAPLKNHAIIEEGVQEEARIQAPPLSRMNTEMLQDQAAEEVFERISALQAEVERMRVEDEERRLAYHEIEQENELLRNDRVELLERHQAEEELLKKQHSQLRDHWKEQLRLKEQELTAPNTPKVASLRAKFEPAIQELAAVKADAETNKIAANDMIKALEAQLHAAREELKEHQDAKASRNAADDRIKALEEQLQAARDETRRYQNQIPLIQEANAATVKSLRADLETKNNEIALERKESIHRGNEAASLTESIDQKDQELRTLKSELKAMKMELDHAHEQLAETRRIVETVEHENDRLVQQNERQARDIADLEERINSQDVNEATAEPVNEKRGYPGPEHMEATSIDEASHKDALKRIEQHESMLSSLKATHAKELRTLRSALLKAGEGMQKREARLTNAHSEEVVSLNQRIETLQNQQTEPSKLADPSMENELRSAVRVLNTKLEKANAALIASKAEAEEAQQAAEDAQKTNAIVNAELEARFAEAVEDREREWRRRVQILFREREKMGKALMWGWGREEEGAKGSTDREQPYRYRFVTK